MAEKNNSYQLSLWLACGHKFIITNKIENFTLRTLFKRLSTFCPEHAHLVAIQRLEYRSPLYHRPLKYQHTYLFSDNIEYKNWQVLELPRIPVIPKAQMEQVQKEIASL